MSLWCHILLEVFQATFFADCCFREKKICLTVIFHFCFSVKRVSKCHSLKYTHSKYNGDPRTLVVENPSNCFQTGGPSLTYRFRRVSFYITLK